MTTPSRVLACVVLLGLGVAPVGAQGYHVAPSPRSPALVRKGITSPARWC